MAFGTLDGFFENKNKKEFQVFVFLLGSELLHLDDPEHKIHHLGCPTYLTRTDLEGFKVLDVGVHPKILFTKDGSEIFELNGIPDIKQLQNHVRRYSTWQKPQQMQKRLPKV